MSAIITSFAYSDLPAPIAAEVRDATARIKDRLTLQVIETGRDLLEVKSKLQHGQFEPWLSAEFNMTTRTAQKYMRAAKCFADKSELSSHLTPNSIFLLSAPSTPEVVLQKVIDAVKSGEPPKAIEIDRMVREAKEQKRLEKEQERREKKRQKMTKEERKKDEELEKRRTAGRERKQRKEEEEFQKKQDAAMATAQMVADILKQNLSNDEIDRICEALDDWRVTSKVLAIFEARAEVHQAHSDNVTMLPLKPRDAR